MNLSDTRAIGMENWTNKSKPKSWGMQSYTRGTSRGAENILGLTKDSECGNIFR